MARRRTGIGTIRNDDESPGEANGVYSRARSAMLLAPVCVLCGCACAAAPFAGVYHPVSSEFRNDVEVLPSALDANGHANNVEFLRWMQDAAVAHADAVGCTAAT